MIGLIVRLIIAPFFAHPLDVYSWYTFGENALNGTRSILSYMVPYDYSFFLFVFPATLAFNFLSTYVGSFTVSMTSLSPALNPGPPWNISIVPGPLFDLLVKLPLIACDLIITLLIYNLVVKHLNDKKLAVLASALWFLNPLSIWISSGWGMFDALPALFTVLTLYLALDKKFSQSGIFLAVAIATKYYALVLVFPLLLVAWKRGGPRGLAESLGGVALAALVLFVPLVTQTTSGFASLVGGSTSSGLHYSGLSFWTTITLFFAFADQSLISDVLIVTLLAAAYTWMWQRRSSTDLFSGSVYFGLPLIVLLLAFRFVGENYFIWLLPFASLLSLKGTSAKRLYWILSLVVLVSSVTDSLLPYYMLPMASWIGGYLVGMLAAVNPYRVAASGAISEGLSIGKLFLSALGILSATVITQTGMNWIRNTTLDASKVSEQDPIEDRQLSLETEVQDLQSGKRLVCGEQ